MIAIESASSLSILTMGHSPDPPGGFLRIICVHGICRRVNLRTIPRSRQSTVQSRKPIGEPRGVWNRLRVDEGGGRFCVMRERTLPIWAAETFPFEVSPTTRRLRISKMAIDDLISVAKDGTTAIMCAEFTLEMSSIIDRGRTGCSEHRNGAYHERLRADENTHRRDGPHRRQANYLSQDMIIPKSWADTTISCRKKRSFGSSLMLASLEARDVVLRDGCRVCRSLSSLSVTRVVVIRYGESSTVEARRG